MNSNSEMNIDSGIGVSASDNNTTSNASTTALTDQDSVHTTMQSQPEVPGTECDSAYGTSSGSYLGRRTSDHTGQTSSLINSTVIPPINTANNDERTSQWVDDSYDIFLKNMDGKLHTLTVREQDKVEDFRKKVAEKIGQKVTEQWHLTTINGLTMQDGMTLGDCKVIKQTTVFCQGRLRGGTG